MSLTIERLLARAQIEEALIRYAQGVDQRDWPLYASAFAQGALIEVPLYMPDALSPEAFAALLRDTFDATRLSGQHLLGNMRVTFTGEHTARSVTEFVATTLESAGEDGEARRAVTPGLYVNDWTAGPDGWRIARHTILRKDSAEADRPFLDPLASAIRHTLVAAHAAPFSPSAGPRA